MNRTLAKFKPGAPRQAHLLLAAALWSLVGLMLTYRGTNWLLAADALWLILPALVIGSLKSHFLLDKTAKKGITRILKFSDRTCLGAVYSIKSWALVGVMIVTGLILRRFSSLLSVLGTLYVAIGWALFFSSRHAWRAWWHEKAK